jgi:hypothetical protein
MENNVSNYDGTRSYDHLTNTHRLLYQTLNQAQQTYVSINDQGSIMEDVADDILETQGIISRSRQIVVKMLCRALINRLFLYFIILALLTGNGVAIFMKLSHK